MTLKVTYDENIDSIVIKVTGSVVCEDIILLKKQILNNPNFRQNINQLFDCSEGKLDLTTDNLVRIASNYMKSADQLGHNRKLALLVSRNLDFGMMRQYEIFFDSGPGVSVCAYKTLLEAKEWLNND